MDAYSATGTDSLGRPSGPRRRRSSEEKRRIVEEALQPGASAASVARRYGLNANLLFRWRRQYLKGRLGGPMEAAGLIPVKLIAPTPNPEPTKSDSCSDPITSSVELKLADGTQVRVSGALAREALREIISQVLSR
jgi:transposase